MHSSDHHEVIASQILSCKENVRLEDRQLSGLLGAVSYREHDSGINCMYDRS